MKFDNALDIERALVLYAHPDDAEFGASGTVAKWAKAGVEVTYAMITNGGSGSSDPAMTHAKLVEIRRAEQLAAAELLGVAHVEFLGFEDGYLEVNNESRMAVARVVRKHRPDVLVAMDPTIRYVEWYVNHPDHIAAGELAMRTINPDASTRLMFPDLAQKEGLEPHKPKAVFLMHWGPGADYVEDITDTLETKLQALGLHASQVGDFDYAKFVRERSEQIASRSEFQYGEGFRILRVGD
ncbi:MAG: PIG-L deacetylase family protein [Actinomycetota bacterium]